MSEITRYVQGFDAKLHSYPTGDYVLYTDHIAALEAVKAEVKSLVTLEPTDHMLNEGQERLCQISSRTSFDDFEQAEIYKAMREVDPAFGYQNQLRLALQLAKDMFVANDLVLPHTMEVIDRALSAAHVPSEIEEIDAMLNDGQGDDDGEQILPVFEPGLSVYAKVEACLHLLERRRDALSALVSSPALEANQQDADAEKALDELEGLKDGLLQCGSGIIYDWQIELFKKVISSIASPTLEPTINRLMQNLLDKNRAALSDKGDAS